MSALKQLLNPWMEGGAWLRSRRVAAQITAVELAEQLRVASLDWVSDIETGRRPVPSVLYADYAAILGMGVADFAAQCLRYYDPAAHAALFGKAEQAHDVITALAA